MQFEKGRTSRENEWTITNPPFKGASINNMTLLTPSPSLIRDNNSKNIGNRHPSLSETMAISNK